MTSGERDHPKEATGLLEPEGGPNEEDKFDSPHGEEEAQMKMSEDEEGLEEDSASNRSLDFNFASKLMDFKLAESDQSTGSGVQTENRHACDVCGKSFKFAGTLTRHKKAHAQEDRKDEKSSEDENRSVRDGERAHAVEDLSPEQEDPSGDIKVAESPTDGEATGKENEESESISEGDCGERKSSEKSDDDRKPKTNGAAKNESKADKRKKVCTICNKRFWSLQDLTRHTRSHTGKKLLSCLLRCDAECVIDGEGKKLCVFLCRLLKA